MNPLGNAAGGPSGALSNGTYCTILGTFRPGLGAPYGGQPIDIAKYTVSLNSGVTAGTVTFQELFQDKVTWINLATPIPLSLASGTALTYQGILNGPYWGLQMVVSGLSGGTIALVQLIGSIRSL